MPRENILLRSDDALSIKCVMDWRTRIVNDNDQTSNTK